jgi:hypothetical protein
MANLEDLVIGHARPAEQHAHRPFAPAMHCSETLLAPIRDVRSAHRQIVFNC